MTLRTLLLLAASLLACTARDVPSPRIHPNDNRTAAGRSRGNVRVIDLEIRKGEWYPEADSGLGESMLAFAERGKPLQIPAPLIRVPAGTQVRATITNRSADSLVLHGFGRRDRTAADSLLLPPGGQGMVDYSADSPGTWFYWAGPPGSDIESRRGIHSQLAGALVVDPAGVTDPTDRVFVLGEWNDPIDTTGPKPWVPRDVMTINGRMWPYTERFSYVEGDSVHWRWVNPSSANHPMHLHGFYYDVMSKGDWQRDTTYDAAGVRKVVTETLTPGATMTMAWQAERPGNWLFHCHFAFHVSHFLSLHKIPDPEDPGGPDAMSHSPHLMAGLVLGLQVAPRESARVAREEPIRRIRVVAREVKPAGQQEEKYRYFVEGDGRAAADSGNPTLVLQRGEPVQLTVVNRLRAATAVHWHGIELADSYGDGVPDWSGDGTRLAPSIAPGDSFAVAFTPPRSGTFMYHSHSNEGHQITQGLYGALLVVDKPTVDTAAERLFILNGDENDTRMNRSATPTAVGMVAGRPYRLRLLNIHGGHTFILSLESDAGRLRWRPLAKDGADLPPHQATAQPASIFMGPGEIADFEFTPAGPGKLRLEATTRSGGVKIVTPIAVQ
jgi:manganese oxidase